MPEKSRPESVTQKRVIKLFCDPLHPHCLGYRFLGNWHQRHGNRCVERELLEENLASRGYSPAHIAAARQKLETAVDSTGVSLYQANLRTYNLLRYGVPVQTGVGKAHETVHLIDWDHPEKNDFALAEEVTLNGDHKRRPDLVLYLNGLAIGVIELKRGSVNVSDGIHQLNTNQEEIFNKAFFSTVQFVFAGNDSQGLRYSTVNIDGTDEKFYLSWKEDCENAPAAEYLLDRPLAQMCEKSRLLDLIRNSIIFDGGTKKVPRVHQYLGLKEAQKRIIRREGGVIWHTQGSGKSILMVLLAKWLLEHDPDGRILVITDRDELDKQIEGVMRNAGVISDNTPSPRITSRAEFTEKITQPNPRLLCALIHKFNLDLKSPPPVVQGRFYIFVDECHRTQGGDMNKQMRRWMENAVFIGFTGTPLLRRDKKTTRDVFGTNIHTYKFDQAVADGVVLDLKYEARAVPQRLTSEKSIEDYFSAKTGTLNNYQRAILRKRWATMEELMSSKERKRRIAANIIHDFDTRDRLNNNRGTAILVAASIYDACHYFRIFREEPFGKYCGIITSFEPNASEISKEPANSDKRYKFDTYTQHVLEEGQATKDYEEKTKNLFITEPSNCKLLIVVSKLLTGFDAPSCTYIYLDNELRDHNLFQAICRTNRLDGEDKEYGYIVDFKELFNEVQNSIAVYTSDELDTDESDGSDGNITVKDWLKEGKKKLDTAREALHYLCEPVEQPREVEQFLRYFCGDTTSNPEALADTEQLRISFYKAVVTFLRAYGALSSDLVEAGYSEAEVAALQKETANYAELRSAIKNHSGEELDTKPYEADMRHLINTYVQADEPEKIGGTGDLSLVDLIIKTGVNDAIAQKLNAKGKLSQNAVAEGIVNNVRKIIVREELNDPKFYANMSALLEELIRQKREETLSYEGFLQGIEDLAKKFERKDDPEVPLTLQGKPEALIIYRNLPEDLFKKEASDTTGTLNDVAGNFESKRVQLALAINRVMREEAPANWKGDETRERGVQNAIYQVLERNREATQIIFDIVKKQPGY